MSVIPFKKNTAHDFKSWLQRSSPTLRHWRLAANESALCSGGLVHFLSCQQAGIVAPWIYSFERGPFLLGSEPGPKMSSEGKLRCSILSTGKAMVHIKPDANCHSFADPKGGQHGHTCRTWPLWSSKCKHMNIYCGDMFKHVSCRINYHDCPITATIWGPVALGWFITPSRYGDNYHKPLL